MKKFLFLGMICMLALYTQAQTANPKVNGPVITWEKNNHDFGDMNQGDKVEHTFAFTNTGNEPLIITNVQVTCGCTTPKGWPRDPIAPGGKGEITIGFNSAGKSGKQNKVVTIVSNSAGTDNQITFTGNVIVKEAKPN